MAHCATFASPVTTGTACALTRAIRRAGRWALALAAASVAALALAACQGGRSEPSSGFGSIVAQVVWPANALSAPLQRSALAGPQVAPASVVTMRATVSGPGMAAVTQDFSLAQNPTGGTVDNVPEGAGRTLALAALDGANILLYAGSTTNITVTANNTTNAGTVTMAVAPGAIEATWVSGSDTIEALGNYGSLGVAAPGNVPSSREQSSSWLDAGGNLWLFGGHNNDGVTCCFINDLWKFDGNNWTWVSGSTTNNAAGSYGSLGVAAPGNVPGARAGALSWSSGGNLWLFGGVSFSGAFNDLWKFDGSNWTWVSGSDTADAAGIYGNLGVAAPGNVPGARDGAVSWLDASGNFWLFAGAAPDGAGGAGGLNDLWKFDGSDWTWVAGGAEFNAAGIYGVLGVPSSDNVPGARTNAVSWIDAAGNLWLFGGFGFDINGALGRLNDLWRY